MQTVSVKEVQSINTEPVFKEAKAILYNSTEKRWKELIDNSAIEQSTRKLLAVVMDSINFYADRFEIVIDARGYRAEDLKCSVLADGHCEIIAQRQETSDSAKKCLSLSRSYQLPQNIVTEQANCYLSPEGILLLTAPWRK